MSAELIDNLAALSESIGAGNLPGDWPLGFSGTLDLLADVAEALDGCRSVLAESRRHTEHFRSEVQRLTKERDEARKMAEWFRDGATPVTLLWETTEHGGAS